MPGRSVDVQPVEHALFAPALLPAAADTSCGSVTCAGASPRIMKLRAALQSQRKTGFSHHAAVDVRLHRMPAGGVTAGCDGLHWVLLHQLQ